MSSPAPLLIVRNATLRPAAEAILAADDGLVASGHGAFETIAAYRGRPFLAEAHCSRLRRAAAALDLACPTDEAWLAAMALALEANGLAGAEPARLRLTLSAPADGMSSWWVEATPPTPHPATARVATVPFARNERGALAGLKTVNYGENTVAQRSARERGADEALFGNTRDELCEGAWSNVFVRVAGRWLTPPLASGCLPGVTRAFVLELGRETGLPIAESTLSMAELDRVESAFLTSSLREIQPVAAIDVRELELSA